MSDTEARRLHMVERQVAARGIRDPAVLDAMRAVPREAFVSEELAEFAYQDSPLPILEGQTISQPYMVALMADALELGPDDRVLDVGTGSGYAAAILSRIVSEVYTVERHGSLAESARRRLASLGYDNVRVLHGDGSRGWPEHAPYDAIAVAAGGPEVPRPLLEQLAIGGRLVLPVGPTPRLQELIRVVRRSDDEYARQNLGGVRFVPLIGEAGWKEEPAAGWKGEPAAGGAAERGRPAGIPGLIREEASRIGAIREFDAGPLLEAIGDARVVLLGEATHGTSEFYRMRARITQSLIAERGFDIVAVEADWPDAARIDDYVRHREDAAADWKAFARFPTWMWRNREVADFVEWLREWNRNLDPDARVGFHGLDLYSLNTSIGEVLGYLERIDPEAAKIARQRYGCLSPWEADPATYGRAVLSGRFRDCEDEVVEMLGELLGNRIRYASGDGDRFMDAVQNARLVANAEQYYRIMYYGTSESWNLRDRHMFDTLELLLRHRGEGSRAVVWEHNSHVGDAAATEMSTQGQTNVGRLSREAFGKGAFLVGFGTDHGTVAAASDWDGPMEVKQVRPAVAQSYERLCHDTGIERFLLPLREEAGDAARDALLDSRLERAIGVIYRPESELQSHYFQAVLPRQFDAYLWFDETHAVAPLTVAELEGVPDTYPFGV